MMLFGFMQQSMDGLIARNNIGQSTLTQSLTLTTAANGMA